MTTTTTKKKERDSHVVLQPPNMFVCLHCGETYEVNLPAPVDVMVGAMKAFNKMHKTCTKRIVCHQCHERGHTSERCPRLDYKGDWRKWAEGPDTGISSIAICKKLKPKNESVVFAYPTNSAFGTTPSDPADFGRCHRLLHAVPVWRARIGEMATEPGWAPLVAHWDELEALYVEELPTGKCPKLYKRMQELLDR